MLDGYERHYVQICTATGIQEGLACINIDHTCQSEFRAYLRHISVKNKDRLPDALQLVVDFIWNNMFADSIRLDLFHFVDQNDPNAKLAADNYLKGVFGMNRRGFKWKTVINDPKTGKRYQVMQMNKPKDYEADYKKVEALR